VALTLARISCDAETSAGLHNDSNSRARGSGRSATPCPELVRLRNSASEAWKQAMRVPPSDRCGALYHASLPRWRHSTTQITITSHATFLSHCRIKWKGTTARRYKLATMHVLDALFDHFQQISSNVEIIGSLAQCSPIRQLPSESGSQPVSLELGKCFPGCPRKRTSDLRRHLASLVAAVVVA
jgi:hypothetical protein